MAEPLTKDKLYKTNDGEILSVKDLKSALKKLDYLIMDEIDNYCNGRGLISLRDNGISYEYITGMKKGMIKTLKLMRKAFPAIYGDEK